MTDYRFPKNEVKKKACINNFSGGKTARRGYYCDEITAGYILMRRPAAPCRWRDIEFTFGMRDYVQPEIFWESVESFVDSYGGIISTLRSDLLSTRATDYPKFILDNGAPLSSCIGFIDCTKIIMVRPGGPGSNQRSCYIGHKI